MKHLAQITADSIVANVIVVPDEVTEETAQEFGSRYGEGRWVLTSIDGEFRKSYAGIGSIYRAELDAFQPCIPAKGWVFSDKTWSWEPPVPMPASIGPWAWDEDNQAWRN